MVLQPLKTDILQPVSQKLPQGKERRYLFSPLSSFSLGMPEQSNDRRSFVVKYVSKFHLELKHWLPKAEKLVIIQVSRRQIFNPILLLYQPINLHQSRCLLSRTQVCCSNQHSHDGLNRFGESLGILHYPFPSPLIQSII